MSAILSSDDLNDFISPGVACIKPIETLPKETSNENPYEVTTEDKVAALNAPPASISLTDCLACSGCVTSAEAVLVSLQSHTEVANTLNAHPSLELAQSAEDCKRGLVNGGVIGTGKALDGVNTTVGISDAESLVFVASMSPQARASLAATYNITERQAGNLVAQLLSGPQGLKSGGTYRSGFTWVLDTNTLREAALVLAADEVQASLRCSSDTPKKPILTSACPGWICYAEKTHPYVLPHLSRLKSPQALAGTLVKSVLSQKLNISPSRIWHLAIMPCFDKKLEASRSELTSASWIPQSAQTLEHQPVRDVDCVITARELVHLAASRSISLSSLPLTPIAHIPFPDPILSSFLFPSTPKANGSPAAGSSGGYLHHIMSTLAHTSPHLTITTSRGRNADVLEHALVDRATGATVLKTARFYGFRNIQNLVRRLKPKRASRIPGAAARQIAASSSSHSGGAGAADEFAYVEVMACPGGCTNGGGQIKVSEVADVRGDNSLGVADGMSGMEGVQVKPGVKEQKEWLARVDEAYYSASSSSSSSSEGEDRDDVGPGDSMDVDVDMDADTRRGRGGAQNLATTEILNSEVDVVVNGISHRYIHEVLQHWADVTQIPLDKLVFTSYREVESDVGSNGNNGNNSRKGKAKKVSDVERVAGLASSIGGGW
ncbi:iron hydrogenase [Pseudovirgaria hyperparasitica]|uniref:Nuclear architecture-related protein 1 n=1 Tax=Pseudovirgaria hyperparasitica TaxID=470096 RepID=A0A6A6WJH2_9PEZI|nr:iron hydrogenase [Pseudovirgaria hyperparasitica]KAF2761937.1 iron hydrogenase [Pseudovirgaria hyperparasitica]